MGTTSDKVREIIAMVQACSVEQIAPDAVLADLGVDSLDRIEVAILIEEEFHIAIDDEKAFALVTVRDLVELVDGMTA